MSITIYDMNGRMVKTLHPASLSVRDLPGGIYFLEISDGKYMSRAKLIKN